jgi:PAS domain S-box-containing protein
MVVEVEDYAIVLLDNNGIILNWNVGAEKIKGYTEEEIVGHNFRIFYLPQDQESGLPEKLIQQAVVQGKAVHEGWRVRKDGTRFWGSIVITALHNNKNEIIGFTKVTRDLSERKIAEDRIRQYAAELEFQNRELEQFAYAASHDLKEPLRKIQFYGSYVIEKNSAQLDEKGRDYLNRAVAAAGRMQQLIEDILSYSRTATEDQPFEMVDANEMAEEILLLHKDEIERNEVVIQLGKLPLLRAIPYQFRQLLDNLVNNAIKYRHPHRNAQIEIASRAIKGADIDHPEAIADRWYHDISVTDNGMGFDQQHAKKMFELFQRLHNKNEFSGSGIGLAICKKIAQHHDGFIQASGKPEEGARFDIFFPVVRH